MDDEFMLMIISMEIDQRVARWLQTFDARGNHRTAIAGDHASAQWLIAQARSFGVEAALEYFPLERVDVSTRTPRHTRS
ncbi:MAG TPA: hypothetical protein VNQ81_10895 [Povalibacter sp.]|nr:hypothetical protein [Povalibacter sp.]